MSLKSSGTRSLFTLLLLVWLAVIAMPSFAAPAGEDTRDESLGAAPPEGGNGEGLELGLEPPPLGTPGATNMLRIAVIREDKIKNS